MTKDAPKAPHLAPVLPSSRVSVPRLILVFLFLAALFIPGQYYANNKYWLPLYSKYMALALFALSVDLVWGYTGLLSLGQGLYFGLGAYAVGYSLKLQQAARVADKPLLAAPDMALPDFMDYCRLPEVPVWIRPLIDIRLALTLAILLPLLISTLFGLVTFRLRIKGVFFALITQALVLAVYTLVVNQQPYTGGVVGMTYLAKLELFGHKFVMTDMYYLITTILVICFLGCALLMRSKFGKIITAIRDNENRVLALGYNTAMYKTFIFALAGALAGLSGALFVSAYGTCGPDSLGIAWSIEAVIWVAAGGRGTLVGAILGAVLVNLANTYFNDKYTNAWPIILGSLFIGVVLFLPDGIMGGLRTLGRLSMKTFGRLRLPRAGQSVAGRKHEASVLPDTQRPPPAQPSQVPNIQALVTDPKGP
ncbi:MAG: urea ABC transporter permease subunit UrtC [Planctomycetota bacterium]|nr:MAG: urea ABC transporter permease subunit UrtC [Planctomycetota bacterium]